MKILIVITGHLHDTAGCGVDLSEDQLEEFGGELETILESYFKKRPHATEEHNQIFLSRVEACMRLDNAKSTS